MIINCNILVIFLISNLNCVFKIVDKTDLSMDKSVDKFFSSNVLESSLLVIGYDVVDNLFYPNEIKRFFISRGMMKNNFIFKWTK